jgi:LPXTG-motif cell wall-anchored protein
MRRLITLIVVFGSALVGFTGAPAAAASYPPTPPPSTGVLGTKTGQVSNSGLPHTGFDPSFVWIALALLVIGLGVLLATRSRRHGTR